MSKKASTFCTLNMRVDHMSLGIWFNSEPIGPIYICKEKIYSTNIQLNFLIILKISNNKQEKTSRIDTNDEYQCSRDEATFYETDKIWWGRMEVPKWVI
jgi:hypothetical protein